MTRQYNRSTIYSFYDLTNKQQQQLIDEDNLTAEELEEDFYVIFNHKDGEEDILALSNFIRTNRNNNFTHGVYSMSYFSAYYITFSRCNSEVVVAYKTF